MKIYFAFYKEMQIMPSRKKSFDILKFRLNEVHTYQRKSGDFIGGSQLKGV